LTPRAAGEDLDLEEETMKKILIATDGSRSAREAVAFGLDLAAAQRAEVVVVHVVRAFDVVGAWAFGVPSALPHAPSAADRAVLEEASSLAEAAGVPAHTAVLRGNPVDEIVAYADSIDADMIVVGSRGHGRAASTFLGSVSQEVLHEARRPVLVVRGAREHVDEPAVAVR